MLFVTISCNDTGTIPDPSVQTESIGNMLLKFADAPAGITTVIAKLSRSGYSDRTLSLSVSDSGASGSFDEVPVGRWHLRIDARDSAQVVRYSGETDVDVLPGQTSNVSLQLMPTTGRIVIAVTWGGPPPDPTLVLYFPFNGNSNDQSGHGNHGIVSGAALTTDRSGTQNRAYAFDGWNNHIDIPDIIPAGISEFSISVWLKPNDIVRRRLCVYLGARTGEAWLQVGDSSFTFGAHPADGSEPKIDAPAIMGEFAHVAAVYRRGSSMQLWVNGTLRSQIGIGNSPLNSGRSTHASSVGSYAPEWLDWWRQHGFGAWQGTIDQVRIYTRALGQTEIQSLYQSGQ